LLRLYVHTSDDAFYRQVGDALADSDYEVLRARQPSDVPPAEGAPPVTAALVHLRSSLDAPSTVAAWARVGLRYGALLIAGVDAEETALRRQLIGLGVDDFLPDTIGSARWRERLALTEQRLRRVATAYADSEPKLDVAGLDVAGIRMSRHGEPGGFPSNLCDVADQRPATQALERERRLLSDLLELQERERRLIAYEIHDGVAQKLTGTLYHLQSAIGLQQEGSEEAQGEFNSTLNLLTQCIAETRQLISGLRPPILDELGIVAALDYLVAERARESACTIRFHHDVRFQRLAPALENALFRIVQESLANPNFSRISARFWT